MVDERVFRIYEPKVISKKWGKEMWLQEDGGAELGYCGKVLIFEPGSSGSLHKHPMKTETMMVLSGVGNMESEGGFKYPLEAGTVIHIPSGVYHSIHCGVAKPLVIMEVSTPHEDGDVVRIRESVAKDA